jgi:hypothetical protein
MAGRKKGTEMIDLRYALGAVVVVAMLAGCGGSQVGTPGAMRQAASGNVQLAHSGSWMLPEAKHEDLLYVAGLTSSSPSQIALFAFKYTSLTLVGTLKLGSLPEGLCSDAHGDVYVTEQVGYAGQLVEFKHGASISNRTISTTPYQPWGCSVAPKSGDLAVAANEIRGTYGPALLVYHKAKGTPTIYKPTPSMHSAVSTAYGARGENFLMGFEGKYCRSSYPCYNFNILPSGGSVLHGLRVPGAHQHSLGEDVGWDGTYLVVLAQELARYQVRRGKATRVGVVVNTEGGRTSFASSPNTDKLSFPTAVLRFTTTPSGNTKQVFTK